MKWSFETASKSFEDIRKDWDALSESRGNHILLDSRFVAPLLRHFGTKDVILAVGKKNSASAMALLVRTRVGAWNTFQPAQSPLGLILFGFDDDRCEALRDLMGALPGYPLILGVSQQDPLYSSFPNISNGANVEILHYIDTPWLRISGTFPEYWDQRGRNLKHNLDRQGRRIKEQGIRLELVAAREPSCMADCLREYSRLEAAGWKGKEGTAVDENNVQGKFYRDIFEDFCTTKEALIFQLLLDGKVVASDLCLIRGGMLVVLKTAYDESTDRLSPSLLMRREILKQFYSDRNIEVIEFYGKQRPWHTQWTAETRKMFHVNVFRNGPVAKTRKFLERWR